MRPFEIVHGSRNIVVSNSIFEGDLASGRGTAIDGRGTGYGLCASEAANITVTNNRFFNWARAGVFGSVNGLTVSGNEIFGVRSDGFDFAHVNNVLIENNHFHDFTTAPDSDDHGDMIQFWTNGTQSPSTSIIIRGNILNSARGGWTQSIFMRNEMVDTYGAGDEMFYRNITIEDNVIYNAHAAWHHGRRNPWLDHQKQYDPAQPSCWRRKISPCPKDYRQRKIDRCRWCQIMSSQWFATQSLQCRLTQAQLG